MSEIVERVAMAIVENSPANLPRIDSLAMACAAIEAYLSALKEQGLVVVPEIPTEPMWRAGAKQVMAIDRRFENGRETAIDTWNEMIDAALKGKP